MTQRTDFQLEVKADTNFYRGIAHLLRAFLEEEKEGLTNNLERTK